MLGAERTVNLAELEWIRNRQAFLAARVDLVRALGGGREPKEPAAAAVAAGGPGG